MGRIAQQRPRRLLGLCLLAVMALLLFASRLGPQHPVASRGPMPAEPGTLVRDTSGPLSPLRRVVRPGELEQLLGDDVAAHEPRSVVCTRLVVTDAAVRVALVPANLSRLCNHVHSPPAGHAMPFALSSAVTEEQLRRHATKLRVQATKDWAGGHEYERAFAGPKADAPDAFSHPTTMADADGPASTLPWARCGSYVHVVVLEAGAAGRVSHMTTARWHRLERCAHSVYVVYPDVDDSRTAAAREVISAAGAEAGCTRTATAAPPGLRVRCPRTDCAAVLGGRVELTAVVKLGTKTGIYRGVAGGRPVVVKQFNALQYARFDGYHAFAAAPQRTPLINVPGLACHEAAMDDAVFQVQPVVPGKDLTKAGRLAWPQRLAVAAQILCTFDFLHRHPAGPFQYDDNHPAQYIVGGRRGGEAGPPKVTLIDIDTLQRAVRNDTADGDAAYTTQCRCFYCRGRSNCLFINHLEGYAGCGQGDGAHGDHPSPAAVLSGRRCSIRGDSFFLAQLLLYIAHGEAPFPGQPLKAVVQHLRAAEFPPARSGDAAYDALVLALFRDRLAPSEALARLWPLCAKYSCGIETCPASSLDEPGVDRGLVL